MKNIKKSSVSRGLITRSLLAITTAGFISGCATQNLADNPINRAAGVLASALAGVNRTVAGGVDSVDKNLMNVQYRLAGEPNEYVMGAVLGTRREIGVGPNPDTTYRPALASKANEVCRGQFQLLDERNPQASIRAERFFLEQRIEREILTRTGQGGYGLPEITAYDRQLLNSYPEAGLVWRIRCGEGQGWTPPPPSRFDITTVPPQDRAFISRAIQNVDNLVANVPRLSSSLYPKALLLVPTEVAMKNIILRSGVSNPQTTVVFWRIGIDGLTRGMQRRNIFTEAETREASRLPESNGDKVAVYFAGDDLEISVPGEPAQVVKLNAASYKKQIGPLPTGKFRQEDGMELAVQVIEEAARRAAKTVNR